MLKQHYFACIHLLIIFSINLKMANKAQFLQKQINAYISAELSFFSSFKKIKRDIFTFTTYIYLWKMLKPWLIDARLKLFLKITSALRITKEGHANPA